MRKEHNQADVKASEEIRSSAEVVERWRADIARAVIVGVLMVTFFAMLIIGWRWRQGAISSASAKFLLVGMGVSIPIYIALWSRLQRGLVRSTLLLLLTFIFLGLSVTAFFWGGWRSPVWLFYMWWVALAGMLVGPKWLVRAAVSVLVYFFILFILSHFFPSLSTLPPDAINFMAFFVLLLAVLIIVTTYFDVSAKERVIAQLAQLKESLEESRSILEERVRERTALLTRRAHQLEIIADLNRFMMGTTSLETLLATVADLLSARLDFYHVGIFLVDDSGEWLRLYAASSLGGKRMMERDHKLRIGREGIVGYVGATMRPRIASDVGEDAVWFDNPDLPETRSEMALPLVSGEELLGVLDIQSRRVNAFTGEDVETLTILANTLSVAISNVRLLTRYRTTLERQERYRLGDVVTGWRKAMARRQRGVAMRYDRIGVRTLSSEALLMEGVSATDLPTDVEVRKEGDGRFVLLIPLRVRNMDLGFLRFESARSWARDEVDLVRMLVEQIALALENARLLEDSRFRAEQEAARSQIVARIRASVQVETILRSAAQELGQALNVERVRVQLLPPAFREEDDRA